MWYIGTMECYSAEKQNKTKNNDNLIFTGQYMEPGKNILSEVTQSQKDKYSMYSLISGY